MSPEPWNPTDVLRARLRSVAPYPNGIVPVPEVIPGTSFFPGGRGLWYEESVDEDPRFPVGGIMVLAQDFYCEAGYRKILERGKAGNAHPSDANTWKGLRPFLDAVPVDPRDCFFTNFFMGLRRDDGKEGLFPGAGNRPFVRRCQAFLRFQLATQNPRIVLVLGRHILPFIAELSRKLAFWGKAKTYKELDASQLPLVHDVSVANCDCPPFSAVALVHPSRRFGTVRGRLFGGASGDAAELGMVRAAIERLTSRAA